MKQTKMKHSKCLVFGLVAMTTHLAMKMMMDLRQKGWGTVRSRRVCSMPKRTLMLEAKGETETEFVEIENCCDLKHTIDSLKWLQQHHRDAFPLAYPCWSNIRVAFERTCARNG
jgi:hypothetical protein